MVLAVDTSVRFSPPAAPPYIVCPPASPIASVLYSVPVAVISAVDVPPAELESPIPGVIAVIPPLVEVPDVAVKILPNASTVMSALENVPVAVPVVARSKTLLVAEPVLMILPAVPVAEDTTAPVIEPAKIILPEASTLNFEFPPVCKSIRSPENPVAALRAI